MCRHGHRMCFLWALRARMQVFACLCVCVPCSLFAHAHCLLGVWCNTRIVTVVSLLFLSLSLFLSCFYFLSPYTHLLFLYIYVFCVCVCECMHAFACLSLPSWLWTSSDKLGNIKIQWHIVSGWGLLGCSHSLIEQRTGGNGWDVKREIKRRGGRWGRRVLKQAYILYELQPPHPFLHRMAVYCSGLINSARWENYF